MTDIPVKENLVVVIYPYKFTDFVYDLMELDEFNRYCHVFVWDISTITTPKFSKGVSANRSKKNEVVILSSLLSFIRCVHELRKLSANKTICILNEVPYSLPSEFMCNLILAVFLKKTSVVILDLYNGGIPIHYLDDKSTTNEITKNLTLYAKFLRLSKNNTTLSEAIKKISNVLFVRLKDCFNASATTHRLVAGEDWLKVAVKKKWERNRIKLVFGHCPDYSNILLHKLKSPELALSQKKIAVFLDGAGPMYGSDAVHLGRKVYFTTDVWYLLLKRFFDH